MKTRILNSARISFPLAAALAALLAAPAAIAQTNGTWTGAAGTGIWGGTGNWVSSQVASGSGATAFFVSEYTATQNVAVNTARTIGNITFTDNTPSHNVNINVHTTPNNLTLAVSTGSPQIDVTQSSRTLTINNLIAGTAGLTKLGAGTLTLTNAGNTLSGNIIVSDGTLTLGNSLALRNATLNTTSSILGTASAGLKTTATTLTLGGLTGDKNFAATGGVFTTTSGGYGGVTALTLNPASGTPTYAGVIANGAANMTLTKTGAGTQVLSGANTYTGTTTISAGTLQLGAADTTGTLATASSIVNNATFAVNRTNAVVQGTDFSGAAITGTGAFTQAGSGTTTLNALNTFSGNVTVNGGTLVADNTETSGNGALGAANNTRSITVATGATLQLAQSKALKALFSSSNIPSLVINGTVNDTNLSNPGNNPLGNVTLNNGTLTASVGNASGYGSYNLNGTVTSTGTSTISSTAPVPITLSAATGFDTTFAVNSGILTVSAGLGQVTAAGDERISSLTKSGTGNMILSGSNTYTGGTNINAGTLTVTSSGSLANTAIATTGTATFTVTPGTGTVTLGNTGTVAAGATLNLASSTAFSMVDGSAGGTTSLVQEASFAGPALTLNGASLNFELGSSAADKLAVTGTASLSGANSINIIPIGTLSSGTYDLITAASGLDTGGTLVFGGTGTTTQTLVSGTNSYLLTLNNAAGVESVTVGAPVTVSGVTWTGQTNGSGAADSNWTNVIGSNWAVGGSPAVYGDGTAVTFDDTNAVTSSGITNSTVTVAAGGVIPNSTTFNHSVVDYTVGGGAIGGSGGVAKSGTGVLTLNAANTYTGATAISAGTLRIGNASALGAGTGASDGTTISAGATLDLGGVSNGANSAAGSERITVSGTGVGGNGAIVSSSAIATPFIGVRYLTLAGNTTLGFSNRWDVGSSTAANNAFVGGGFNLTFLGTGPSAQASLNFLGETDLGDVTVNLGSDTATNILYLQGDTTLGQPGKTVTVTGGSTLHFFSNVTPTIYDKKFALDNGSLNFNRANTTFTLPGTISLTNSNTVTSNVSTTNVIASNEISGTGSLTKAGPGTLTLSGPNSYGGTTTVNAGSLIVQNPTALGNTTGGTSVTNGRVELDNLTVAGEAISLIGNGTNFLGALQGRSGSSEWSGNITINADGTRIGANNGASLLVSGVIDDGINDYRLMYRVGDAAASVTLTGANTYTGITSIVGAGPVIVGSLNSVVGGAASSHLGAPVSAENGKIIIGTTTVNGTLRYVGPGETTDRTIQIGENATTPVAGDTGGAAIENNGTTGALVFSAPTFNIPTDAVTGTSPARTLTLGGSNTGANTVSGIIQNNLVAGSPTAAVNLAKTGAGSWTLAGANTYTGSTTIDQGTLVFATNPKTLAGGLTFGAAAGSTNFGSLELPSANASFGGGLVVRTNSATANTIGIGAGRNLTFTGSSVTNAITVGNNTSAVLANLQVSGAGTLTIDEATRNIVVATVDAAGGSAQMDLSGLAAFNATVANLYVGRPTSAAGAAAGGRPADSMNLAGTNNLTVSGNIVVGAQASVGFQASNFLRLGTVNTINAGAMVVGNGRINGNFTFNTGLTNPSATLRGATGGTSRVNITLGDQINASGVGDGGGGSNQTTGTMDFTDGTVDAMIDTLLVGVGGATASNNRGRGVGIFTFGAGSTVDINTLIIGRAASSGSASTNQPQALAGNGTFNMNGGTLAINTAITIANDNDSTNTSNGIQNVTGTFNQTDGATTIGSISTPVNVLMGSHLAGGNSGLATATMTLTGGTTSVFGNIQEGGLGAGTITSTLTLNGGSLDLNGNALGVAGSTIDNLNFQAGTLTNVASINGSGGLTKTTAGTLLLGGTISYAGDTTVSEGTLTLSSAASPTNANPANDASTVTIAATGATLNLTYTGTDLVDKLFVGASQLAAGTYGKVGSTAPVIGIPQITGDGTLTVASGTNYASWIASFALTGNDALADSDPDFDGIDNAVEMVLGGNPATGMDTALLPTIELVTNPTGTGPIPAGDYLLFTYRRTDLSVAAGVTADCETDTDLVAPWTAATGAPGVVIEVDNNFTFTPPAASDTDRVRVYVPRGANPKLFGRINVVVP